MEQGHKTIIFIFLIFSFGGVFLVEIKVYAKSSFNN